MAVGRKSVGGVFRSFFAVMSPPSDNFQVPSSADGPLAVGQRASLQSY